MRQVSGRHLFMPTTNIAHPTTYFAARTDSSGYYPAGFYTDPTDADVEAACYEARITTDQSFADIAVALDIQCPQFVGQAIRRHARRNGIETPTRYRRVAATRRTAGRYLLNRRFGVEIETSRGTMRSGNLDYLCDHHPVTTAAEFIRAEGVDAQVEQYNHNTPSAWKVTYDCTVTGVEAVSPILRGDEGWESMRSAMRGLKAAGATPGGGIHVHHDITDFTTQAQLLDLVNNLQATQDVLLSYLPQRRRESQWCRRNNDRSFDRLRTSISDESFFVHDAGRRLHPTNFYCPVDRYSFFNFQPTGCYGTVEFRGHGASLNPLKLRTWIAIGQAIVEASRQGIRIDADDASTPEALTEFLVARSLLVASEARKFVTRCNANG